MITASTSFINAVNENGRTFRARILCDNAWVDCDIRDIKIMKGSNDGDTFMVGSVFSSYASITVSGCSAALENKDISVFIGVATGPIGDASLLTVDDEQITTEDDEYLISDGVYDYIQVGTFTVTNAPSTTHEETIAAYGAIATKLKATFTGVAEQSFDDLAAQITAITGVPVTFVGFDDTTGIIEKDLAGATCRDVLEVMTFCIGGYATETITGDIVICKYEIPDSTLSVDCDRMITPPVTEENAFNMTGIEVVITGDEEDVTVSTGTVRQVYSSAYMTETLFDDFASNIIGYTFMPADIDLTLGDPRLEPWDCLTVTDMDENEYTVPCHNIEIRFDGGISTQIRAIGESVTESEPVGIIAKQLEAYSSRIQTAQQTATSALETAESAASSVAQDYKVEVDSSVQGDVAYLTVKCVTRGGTIITDECAETDFQWYMKSEAEDGDIFLGVGMSIEIEMDDINFGAEIYCDYLYYQEAILTDSDGEVIETLAGYQIIATI